jgi:hypothetical protein
MTVDTRNRSLIARWRELFTNPAPATALPIAPAPVTATATATEEEPVGQHHVYVSDAILREPGEETTALGWADTPSLRPVDPGERTQVIRVEPPARTAAEVALDPATEVHVEAEAYDPPIYLSTVAAVQRLNELPPASEDTTDQPEEGGETREAQ